MNMTNQYKILALDLDGTLLDAQSRITPENARAVRMAQQAGVQIVLCTGRNVREVRRFSEQLEAAPDWLVTANGAAVQHPDDREPAFFDGLSTEMVDIILNECTAIDTDPCLYTTQDLYYGHAFRHFLENLQRRGRVVMDEADEVTLSGTRMRGALCSQTSRARSPRRSFITMTRMQSRR